MGSSFTFRYCCNCFRIQVMNIHWRPYRKRPFIYLFSVSSCELTGWIKHWDGELSRMTWRGAPIARNEPETALVKTKDFLIPQAGPLPRHDSKLLLARVGSSLSCRRGILMALTDTTTPQITNILGLWCCKLLLLLQPHQQIRKGPERNAEHLRPFSLSYDVLL